VIAAWLVFVAPLVAVALAFAWLEGAVTLLTTVPLVVVGFVCALIVDALTDDTPPANGAGR